MRACPPCCPAGRARQRRTVTFTYDEAGRIVAETDPLGRRTTTRFSANSLRPEASRCRVARSGRLSTTSWAACSPPPTPWAARKARLPRRLPRPLADRAHRCQGRQEAPRVERLRPTQPLHRLLGQATRYEYDAHGHLAAVTNALDETVRFERLADGQASRWNCQTAPPKSSNTTRSASSFNTATAPATPAAGNATAAASRSLRRRQPAQAALGIRRAGQARGAAKRRRRSVRDLSLHLRRRQPAVRRDAARRHRAAPALRRLRAVARTSAARPAIAAAETHQAKPSFARDAVGRLLQQTTTRPSRPTPGAGTGCSWRRTATQAGAAIGVTASSVTFSYDKAAG